MHKFQIFFLTLSFVLHYSDKSLYQQDWMQKYKYVSCFQLQFVYFFCIISFFFSPSFPLSLCLSFSLSFTHIHTQTHARTHAHTHTFSLFIFIFKQFKVWFIRAFCKTTQCLSSSINFFPRKYMPQTYTNLTAGYSLATNIINEHLRVSFLFCCFFFRE